MARVELEMPFASASGRFEKNSTTYYTTRYGKTIASNYPLHKDQEKVTERQREQNSRFKQAVEEAQRQLADPKLKAMWKEKFEHQPQGGKQYHVLRNFVIAQLIHQQTT